MFPCGGTVCHFCELDESPIYNYNGVILHPDHAANPNLARDEQKCPNLPTCILGGHAEKDIEPRIQKTINRFAKEKQVSLEDFHRTPDIPLLTIPRLADVLR